MPDKFILKRNFPTLRSIGVAVQHFLPYRHPDQAPPHAHDILEMIFVLKGSGRHLIGEEASSLGPGSLQIIHYEQRHELVTDKEGMELVNIYVDPLNHPLPDMPSPIRDCLVDLLPLHPQFGHLRNRILHLQIEETTAVSNLLRTMQEEQNNEACGHEEAMFALFSAFLIYCGRAVRKQKERREDKTDNSTDTLMERLRLRLDREFDREHSLADLAESLGCTPNYLCRRFKSYTGKPIFQYIAQRRIHHAMLRLRTTEEKIMSIAFSCGFRDLGHFNRKFREIADTSPRRYREQFY
jgi:AraC-like DNA-binding protein